MPIYGFVCCDNELEVIQEMGASAPICLKCGGSMVRKPSAPAIIQMTKRGGRTLRSKGYKEGYKKEYLKSKGQEVWRGTITEPQT